MFDAILRAFRYAKLIKRYATEADADGAWSDGNAKDLAAFFNTTTGQLFKTRLQNYVFRAAVAATQAGKDSDYHCGVARGVAMTVGIVQDHFITALQQQEEVEQEASMPDNSTSLAALLSP